MALTNGSAFQNREPAAVPCHTRATHVPHAEVTRGQLRSLTCPHPPLIRTGVYPVHGLSCPTDLPNWSCCSIPIASSHQAGRRDEPGAAGGQADSFVNAIVPDRQCKAKDLVQHRA